MKETMLNFMASPGHGLMLMTAPPGSGKSYAMVQAIRSFMDQQKEYEAAGNDERMFFKPEDEKLDTTPELSEAGSHLTPKFLITTPYKKNLAVEDVKSKIGGEYVNEILFLDSNMESFNQNFTNELRSRLENSVPDLVRSEQYRKLVEKIDTYHLLQEKNMDPQITKAVAEEIAVKLESSFRHLIQEQLSKEYKSFEARQYAIHHDSRWNWLPELYPACLIYEKRVLLLSVKKLLYPISPIIGPSIHILQDPQLEGSILFIDEFDSSKNEIEDAIIESGLRYRVDYLSLFTNMLKTLHLQKLPMRFTGHDEAGRKKYGGYVRQLETIRKQMDEIYEKYNMNHFFRLEDNRAPRSSFLFASGSSFIISVSDTARYLVVKYDDEQEENHIYYVEHQDPQDPGQHLLATFFNEMYRCIVALTSLANKIGNELAETQIAGKLFPAAGSIQFAAKANGGLHETWKTDEEIKRDAIDSVMDYLTPNENEQKFLKEFFSSYRMPDVRFSDALIDQNSFYAHGMNIYTIENNSSHMHRSDMNLHGFPATPERYLLLMAEKFKVIGLSATATQKSVACNYDLEFIERCLQDHFVRLDPADQARMHHAYQKAVQGYDQIDIHVELLADHSKDEPDQLNQLFLEFFGPHISLNLPALKDGKPSGTIYRRDLSERLAGVLKEDGTIDTFTQSRLWKLGKCYESFLENEDIHAFLALLNGFPKKNARREDIGVKAADLEFVFRIIRARINQDRIRQGLAPLSCELDYVILTSRDFENNKKKIHNQLEQGKKLFVISTYNTLGAGQNMQYPVPKQLVKRMVQTNPLRQGNDLQKDFDALYIDRPTHLISPPTLDQTWEEYRKSQSRYVMQTARYFEAGEITRYERDSQIRKALEGPIVGKSSQDMYKASATVHAGMRVLEQAIGRLSRTSCKNPDIYLFVDGQIEDHYQLHAYPERPKTPEMQAFEAELEKHIQSRQPSKTDQDEMNEEARRQEKINSGLQALLSRSRKKWEIEDMQYWRKFRQHVLKYPGYNNPEDLPDYLRQEKNYIKNRNNGQLMYYLSEFDFKKITISMRSGENFAAISEKSSRLEDYLEYIPGFKGHMENCGYAVNFMECKNIIGPVVFNNIYKGALGEEAGSYIFNMWNIPLDEIEDPFKFEKFDFICRGINCYIDFKNWAKICAPELTCREREDQFHYIAKKAFLCGTHHVIIANVFEENQEDITTTLIEYQYQVQGPGKDKPETRSWPVKIILVPELATRDGLDSRIFVQLKRELHWIESEDRQLEDGILMAQNLEYSEENPDQKNEFGYEDEYESGYEEYEDETEYGY